MILFHQDATGCSVDGVSYSKNAEGSFDVADEHAAPLLDHGFTTTPPEGTAPKKGPGRPKKGSQE